MTRVVHVARYRQPMLDRKMAILAGAGEFAVSLVRPAPARALPEPLDGPPIDQVVWLPLIGHNPHTAVYRALTFALQRLRPDLIHAEEEPDSITALQIVCARRLFAPRARLVLHTWQNINRQKRWHVWRVIRTVLAQADGVLGSTAEAVELLHTLGFHGLTDQVPQYGVDLTTFQPAAHRHADTFSILAAGRLIADKGFDTLIDAARLLDVRFRLTLIGDGPERQALEERGRSLNIHDRIDFLSRMSPPQLAAMMARADVLVLPSRTTSVWKEQFGRVLVEAMACGLPIVGSDSGAIPYVVGNAGLIFAEGNVNHLAERLRHLAESPALRAELGASGRQRVADQYSEQQIAARTAAFYRRVLST
jgi:glycosyltransferase involved in cell wall biosynthesis